MALGRGGQIAGNSVESAHSLGVSCRGSIRPVFLVISLSWQHLDSFSEITVLSCVAYAASFFLILQIRSIAACWNI